MAGKSYAIIMAGGKGERFWPLSTSKHPKQVLSLVGGKPLLVLAVERLKGLIPPGRILVITSKDLVKVTAKTVPALPKENIIGEPFGRDTAAVCALASGIIKARDPNGLFCVLTADHVITDITKFQQNINDSLHLAATADILITIGIKPTFPSTGFGYIETGNVIKAAGKTTFLKALRFVEKPDKKQAEKYIVSGNFCWNSGMFVCSVTSMQNALARHAPQLLKMANRMEKAAGTNHFNSILANEYSKLEKISFDYAVMEKSDNIIMAKASFKWDDVGSWTALENHFTKDNNGNVIVGISEILDSFSNIVVSNDRLTALLGVRDLVVVQAEDATLVCHKDKAQEVKKMVQLLMKNRKYKSLL
ncbi:MAG: sugar phosphate nucleotidyltransferase [Kiritimatiellae bacterium]|nr:sugar phosphate nucleotidyltransferase [Kiritimatiellia bacterium]MDD5521254.1 sugar phosphate nucleotidyltransferase [Kiritimatiellia bacterium]